MSDGAYRTIDSRGIFAPTVMFTAIHQSGRWGTRTLDLSRVNPFMDDSLDDSGQHHIHDDAVYQV
jgi:hypothetical protein